MKAILINDDKSLYCGEVPTPVLKDDEVLIKTEYAALNRADLMQREGNYAPPPGAPEWMGLEVSGEIIAVGKNVTSRRSGEKVCALLGGGGYAEYVAVRHDHCMPVPENTSMAEAAALPEAFATAYLNLFIEGKAKAGDTILMNAGKSGLASVVIPMAKAFGMRVITTVRGEKAVKDVSHLGADLVVDTLSQDVTQVLKNQLNDGHGVEVAIDCLGGEVMGKCLHYLNHGARWIVIAALAGQFTDIDLRNVFIRNVRIIGSTLRSRPTAFKAELLRLLTENVWDKVASGEIRPHIYKILPIGQAEEAQAILMRGENVGKVVLSVSPSDWEK